MTISGGDDKISSVVSAATPASGMPASGAPASVSTTSVPTKSLMSSMMSSASSAASSTAAAASSSFSSIANSQQLKKLYDGLHYAQHGYTPQELLKYTTVNPDDSDSQRIATIEKGVNELNLVIKSSVSISKVARNAFISYIVTYILFAIIIILNVGILVKKACQNVSASDSFSNNESRNPPTGVKMREIIPGLQQRLYT